MKAHCGQGLRIIVAAALLIGGASGYAQAQQEARTRQVNGSPSQVAPEAPEAGQNVVAVRIVTEDGRVLSESPVGLPVSIGKPLDRDQIAESIRTLYRTGDFADVRAVSVPAEGGVRVDFVVREQLYFNQVVIRGLVSPPTEASAIAAVQLPLGEPYQADAVNEGLERLRDLLNEEGLYAAQVSAQTVPHPQDHEMDVIIEVQPGPRAHIKDIELKNGTEYTNAEILSRSKLKPGATLTAARVQRGTSRVRNFLVKKGHLNARAVARRGTYDAKSNTIPLEFEVTEGPLVRLAVTGAKFSGGELKKLVPVYQEGAVDTDLLEEGKRNIRERLERNGYFDAEVDYAASTNEVTLKSGHKGSEEVITYRVERGDRHTLLRVEITGNRYFDNELLRSRMVIYPKGFQTRGRFSRRLLEADRDSMQNLYLANGFLEAKVDAQALDNYKGKEGDLVIRFVIQEGKQTRVASLKIDGAHALKQDALLGVVASTPGQPYSDFNVATDRDNILALYFNEGFPEAKFTASADRVNEPEKKEGTNATPVPGKAKGAENDEKIRDEQSFEDGFVNVVYRIEEGPQIRVKRILLSGYDHTRPGVIRREVRVQPDAPLREGEVVESQRRLYNLGVFNRVTIQPQNPNGADTNKDIVVLVEEAKRYTLAYGGGVEVQRLGSTTNPAGSEVQAAIRGILEISKLNVTGRGDALSLKLRGSTLEDRALLAYNHPNAFNDPHLSLQVAAYTERTQDINTFTATRYEGSVLMNDLVTPRTSLLYRYTFRKVLVSNLNTHISPEEVPLFSAPTLVSQFSAGWVRDARDNPADATRGNFNSAEFSVADTNIGSSASFMRFYLQNSTYHPIRRRFSFARSIRIGILEPYSDTVSLTFPAPTTPPLPTVIPLPERFFAGGGTSLRGFALNQAGPRDSVTGFPVGGQALLILNQEFRFPLRVPFANTAALSGALFYDGGNVYSRASRITFRAYSPKPIFNPANPKQCQFNCTNELNYFSHTVGLGLRYGTPVGPIRVDLGYQINRPLFVTPICPQGVATAECQQGQFGFKATRLPGFQIFFNLGSTF